MSSRCAGVTALDLLITLTIVTLLLSAGVPAFRSYGQNQRLTAAVSSLQSDLQFARGEAIRLATHTLACPGSPLEGCLTARDWNRGWIVFADLNGDREWQAGESLLKSGAPLAQLAVTSPASRSRLRFFPNGTAPGSNTSITFCDARGTAYARQIRVSNSGRIRRVEAGAGADPLC